MLGAPRQYVLPTIRPRGLQIDHAIRHYQNPRDSNSEHAWTTIMTIDRVVLAFAETRAPPRRRSLLARLSAASNRDWRSALRRHLVWLLAAKFAALTLIWALFFRRA
jgi:hypothetical protein